jgi:hypothetical protein
MRLAKAFFLAAAVAGAALHAGDAAACGGCFIGITETQSTQVTGHKMVLSVSQTQTTLYDQIEYSGNPASFAWILPIKGTATVGLSSDALFQALDGYTQVTIQSPTINCGGGCTNAAAPGAAFGGGQGGAETGTSTGVTVIAQQTVGPYETVQLQSSDPSALTSWLSSHGYNVPSDISPIISAYVSENFDFLAMKLVPGQGVSAMKPVRVTTTGASPVLPLRMVAAGTGTITPITLWVLAEGRYDTVNLPSFQITDDQLVWDWDTQQSNYASLKQAGFAASSNRAWLIDDATPFSMYDVSYTLQNSVQNDPVGSGYADAMGQNAAQNLADDMSALLGSIPESTLWITRMESQLSRAALAADLQVGAAADQSVVQNYHVLSHTIGTPPACPPNTCGGGGPNGANPAPGLGLFGTGASPVAQGGTCAMGRPDDGTTLLGGLGVVAALVALSRRPR